MEKSQSEKTAEILKEHVSAYSLEISKKFEHGQTVRVGGVVKSVFDANSITPGSTQLSGFTTKEDDAGVYVIVDDGIGEILLVLFQVTYGSLLESIGQEDMLQGKMIVVDGTYVVLDKRSTLVNKNKTVSTYEHPNDEKPRVFCHTATLIN